MKVRRSTQFMRAAMLASPGRFEIRETTKPRPGPGEIRVRVEGCGVCASNLEPWMGRLWFSYPFAPGAPGHEAFGWVDEPGPGVDGWKQGERVAMLSYNAYADYDVAPASVVVRLPADFDGQPVPGEPLGCAMNAFARSGIGEGAVVGIVGIGFLGALLTQLAAAAGARVIALSRRAYSLEVARRMGAEETIALGESGDAIAAVKELTAGLFCDVAIEAAGKQSTLDIAAEITRERGRLVIAGYHQDAPRQVNMQLWNWRGLDVINAHERDPAKYVGGIRAAVEAMQTGSLRPAPLCTHRFPLEQLSRALEATRDRPEGFMKALIVPSVP